VIQYALQFYSFVYYAIIRFETQTAAIMKMGCDTVQSDNMAEAIALYTLYYAIS
jgi:hypothetical protein